MKSAVFALALAALVRAEDGPGPNPHLGEILDAMPDNLVAAMSYFPSSFINGLMDGSVWLPTEASDLLALATGIPSDEVAAISSDYAGFISEISSLLPTPTDGQNDDDDDKDSSEEEETSAEESESEDSENSSSSDTEATTSGSSKDDENETEEDTENTEKATKEHDDDDAPEDDSETSSSATHVVRSFGLIAAVVACAALF
ncbi:hypothetical protein H4R24_004335 [Coemansia sp. RSA 988]|nr:hypothetical protein H4R24_004335 [Coemansia sp. RSA 988]